MRVAVELAGRDAVTGEEPVERGGGGVPRRPPVADEDPAAAAAQGEGRAQTGAGPPDNDGVELEVHAPRIVASPSVVVRMR